MFCGNCGKKIENNVTFCSNCGKQVKENNNSSSNNVIKKETNSYGMISVIIGIVSLIAPAFLFLSSYKLAFNILSYIVLLIAEIFGIVLGIKGKGRIGGKAMGIILNTISISITIICLLIVLVLYGFSSLNMP